jgi:hypothetical protein
MKLYNIYNEIILESVTNFKTWISGSGNITKTIIDLLADDSGGKFYYCDIVYPNEEGSDQQRWVIITQYGISKLNNPIIRVLEVNNGLSDGIEESKTFKINDIKRMRVSKVPIYQVPEEFLLKYGDIANHTTSKNPFKVGSKIYTAKFGSYKYADSTLKQKGRTVTKAAELEKQQGTEKPVVEPVIQQPTQEPTVEPTTQQQTAEPEVPQQEPEEEELINPEEPINPEDEENNNRLKK